MVTVRTNYETNKVTIAVDGKVQRSIPADKCDYLRLENDLRKQHKGHEVSFTFGEDFSKNGVSIQ